MVVEELVVRRPTRAEPDSRAERRVREAIDAVVREPARVYPNVRWISSTREGGPARNGEIDLVVVDPARGILAIEVKGGPVRRDGFGRWYAGERHLDEPPYDIPLLLSKRR